jgi:hypothetical protein
MSKRTQAPRKRIKMNKDERVHARRAEERREQKARFQSLIAHTEAGIAVRDAKKKVEK